MFFAKHECVHFRITAKLLLSGHHWDPPKCPFNRGCRGVIKRRDPGISSGYYERFPWLFSKENKRKIEPKEILSCLIPCLLVVFTWQLEILVTTLVGVHLIEVCKNCAMFVND